MKDLIKFLAENKFSEDVEGWKKTYDKSRIFINWTKKAFIGNRQFIFIIFEDKEHKKQKEYNSFSREFVTNNKKIISDYILK